MAHVQLHLPGQVTELFPTATDPTADVWVLVPTKARSSPLQMPPAPATMAHQANTPNPSQPAATSEPSHVLCQRGAGWELRMPGCHVYLRQRKGYRALVHLLEHPDTSIPAITLKAAMDGVDQRQFAGTRGEVLSPTALGELRRRASELRQDLADARAASDALGEEQIMEELTAIAQAIRGGQGTSTGPRQLSDSERVRVAMRNTVSRCVWSIEQQAPAAASYFRRTISTGTVLCYRPIAGEQWVTTPP